MVPIPVSDALFLKEYDFNVANGNLDAYLGMGQNLLLPYLEESTSINQLF